MEAPDVATLKEVVVQAVNQCVDSDLLDLILKILAFQ